MRRMLSFFSSTAGLTAAEYGLIGALVVVTAITAATSVTQGFRRTFDDAAVAFGDSAPSGGSSGAR